MKSLNNWGNRREETVYLKKTYKRFSFQSVFSGIMNVILLDKGFFYTFKQLVVAPGETIRSYLGTGRERFTGPVRYYLIAITLYYFVFLNLTHTDYFDQQLRMSDNDLGEEYSFMMETFFLKQLKIWSAFAVFFISGVSYFLFRRLGLNYIEHVVINLYISAQTHFFIFFLLPVNLLTNADFFLYLEPVISLVFYTYVVYYLFRENLVSSVWKSLLILGTGFGIILLLVSLVTFVYAIYVGIKESYSENVISVVLNF